MKNICQFNSHNCKGRCCTHTALFSRQRLPRMLSVVTREYPFFKIGNFKHHILGTYTGFEFSCENFDTEHHRCLHYKTRPYLCQEYICRSAVDIIALALESEPLPW